MAPCWRRLPFSGAAISSPYVCHNERKKPVVTGQAHAASQRTGLMNEAGAKLACCRRRDCVAEEEPDIGTTPGLGNLQGGGCYLESEQP